MAQYLLQNENGGGGGEVFQSGEAITKKARIVQKDSDISVLEPQSLKVKLL